MSLITQIMQTEAALLAKKICCYPGCTNKADMFDDLDNPICEACYELHELPSTNQE